MTFFTSLLSFCMRGKSRAMRSRTRPSLADLSSKTLVFDVEGGLLRSPSTFPYFMLVALEGGGFVRGLLLLLAYPIIYCLSQEMGIRVMAMISFCGLRKGRLVVGRAVLPKFLLEEVGLEGFEVMRRGKRRVCVSRMPRVMVEGFLKEYLEVEVVVGRELKVFCGFYTGFLEEDKDYNCEEVEEQKEGGGSGSSSGGGGGYVGVLNSTTTKSPQESLFTHCKELYLVTESEKRKWHPLPREKYPNPLIFHDGRIAFRPNFVNTLVMYIWLPIALPLAILRLIIAITLPYNISTPILALTSMKWRLKGSLPPYLFSHTHLFVCNHRTLIDPVYVAVALNKPVATVTYSVSRVTELISPIKMVRLTRDRDIDGRAMERMLSRGHNLVVCPEGTTCREPYLLRFSPLFAELTEEIVAVAVDVTVSMFYATTAGGFKGFDSLYYMMNPSMCYEVEFLGKIDTSGTVRDVGKGIRSSIEMANLVQGVIGRALGFECTRLTRKDKYMMLAGNNGIVGATNGEKIK